MQLLHCMTALAVAALIHAAPLDPRTDTPILPSRSKLLMDLPVIMRAAGSSTGKPTTNVFTWSRKRNPRPTPLTTTKSTADGTSPGQTNGTSPGMALNTKLVPSYGVTANIKTASTQPGSCDGSNGVQTIAIPCTCPPPRAEFLAKLATAAAAGKVLDTPVRFSNNASDTSERTNKARATAMVVVLQNFSGKKGVGCPAVSAPNFLSMQKTGKFADETFIPVTNRTRASGT